MGVLIDYFVFGASVLVNFLWQVSECVKHIDDGAYFLHETSVFVSGIKSTKKR